MVFAYYDERLDDMPFLCVDGVVPGGLNLSHWPGNRTPAHLKADTTTEMALKLARDPGRDAWLRGVSIITNNHFDTDGLLSVYGVLRPEEAVPHERALVQAARAGDFGAFSTAEAFKFDAVVTAFDDDRVSPLADRVRGREGYERYAILYEALLAMMPGLLLDTSRYKSLWAAPLQSLMRSLIRIKDVARIRELEAASLTVIETGEPLDQIARFNMARYHRVLTATRSAGGIFYEMAFQIFSWFDTVTPVRGSRVDLSDAAVELNRLEIPGVGRWVYTGNDSLESRLYRAAADGTPIESSLPLDTVETLLVGLFEGRP